MSRVPWQCPTCGRRLMVPEGNRVYCCPPGSPPGLVQKAVNFKTARDKWIEAGRPLRTDEETAALRVICTACIPYYDAASGRCTHKKCGCKVSGPGWLGDKLKWATEHCPVGKW